MYGLTKAETDGTLGFYAIEDATLKYTVVTVDRFGCETVTLVFGANLD